MGRGEIMNKRTFRDLSVGETFNIGAYKLKVEETEKPCKNCFMLRPLLPMCDEFCQEGYISECVGHNRKDKKNVMFIEVE